MMNSYFHERSCLFWWYEAAICTLRTKPSLTWSSWHGMKVTSNHPMLYQKGGWVCFNKDLATGTWDFTDQKASKWRKKHQGWSQISKSLEHSNSDEPHVAVLPNCQTSKVITGASSVSFSSASFCEAWGRKHIISPATMPWLPAVCFLSEVHVVASQSSHIANGSLDTEILSLWWSPTR